MRIHILRIIALLVATLPTLARAAVEFPRESVLATGRWVRVTYKGQGLHQISYEQLRAMGFSDPSKVMVYGQGGARRPMQFRNNVGDLLQSTDAAPVATLHLDGKIVFYGFDTFVPRQMVENLGKSSYQQFAIDSENTYVSEAAYLLTDSHPGLAPREEYRAMNFTGKEYTHAWAIQHHNLDSVAILKSGCEYFGENLVGAPRTFSFSIPGATKGAQASLSIVAIQKMSTPAATLNVSMVASDSTALLTTPIAASYTGDYYGRNTKGYIPFQMPGEQGEMTISYEGTAPYCYLDHYIIAAKRELRFGPDEKYMEVYTGDYTDKDCGTIIMLNAPEDIMVWDVASPSDVNILTTVRDGSELWVRYLRPEKSAGTMVAFSKSAELPGITGWSPMENVKNLHAIAPEQVPDMLIITLPQFAAQAQRIADIHRREEGIETMTVFSQDIIDEFGHTVPDPMAYRLFIKMLYDRDTPGARRFKNVLLLGPCLHDYRGITVQIPAGGTLLCNQTLNSRNIDESFTLNDWLGMMEDRTSATPASSGAALARVPMHVAIANIPLDSPEEVDVYIDKIEQFYADTSLALWLGDASFCTDGADNNEHQNLGDLLYRHLMDLTDHAMTGTKCYNNLYAYRGSNKAWMGNLSKGSLINYYFGHSDTNGLSGEFWLSSDADRLSNARLGFMTMASCSVTEFDLGVHGAAEKMVWHPGSGLIAAYTTTRRGLSYSNYVVSDCMQRAMYLNDPERPGVLLHTPRTLGEAYMLAKNTYISNSNKHSYVLLGDPAIVLPLPTASVEVKVNGETGTVQDPVQVYPLQTLTLNGEICDREGKPMTGFNGSVVARMYEAPVKMTTRPRSGSSVTTVEVDENSLAQTLLEVKGGRFQGTLTLPADMAPCDSLPATLRLSAFDPATRLSAIGAIRLNVNEFDPEKAVPTDTPPCIEDFYARDRDWESHQPLASDFTLYAKVTDDLGLRMGEIGGVKTLSLLLDGWQTLDLPGGGVNPASDGKSLLLTIPVKGLTPGLHEITLLATDLSGQIAESRLNIVVGEPMLRASLSVPDIPGRSEVEVTLVPEDSSEITGRTFIVLDARGKEIFRAPMQGNTYEWNLLDNAGERVAPGSYRALVRLSGNAGAHGATQPQPLTIF